MIIVYVADENYLGMIKKSMVSYRKYNPTAHFVVVSERPLDIDVENVVIDIGEHRGLTRISNAAYLKLYLTKLPHDKIIYVDCDTLCQYPLNELWEMPCDYINLCETYWEKQLQEFGHYGLTGMMVMNLNALRDDNFTEKCLEVEKTYPTPQTGWRHDETCINVAYKDKINYIDDKWNYCHNREYGTRAIHEWDAKILHIVGHDKSYMDNFPLYSKEKGLLDYLKGKNVAIVGNAQSQFEKNYGKEIDKAEIVIRFNKGFISKPESQGTKTNILMLACDLTDDELSSYGAEIIVNRSKNRHNKADYTISDEDRAVLRDKIYICQPSTGFIAIDLCLTANAKSITTYGFDWEKTPTFYNPQFYKTKHNYGREEELVRLYEKSGILTIKE